MSLTPETDFQKDCIAYFKNELQYDYIDCRTDKNDLGREHKKEVLSKTRLRKALRKLNTNISAQCTSKAFESAINASIKALQSAAIGSSALQNNKAVYHLLLKGYETTIKNKKGQQQGFTFRYIDFHLASNNEFVVAEEVTTKGKYEQDCRTDLLVYVNGIPLVLLELKNPQQALRKAFDDNLTKYKRVIPLLFSYNAFVLLANVHHAKVGSFTAGWEHFSAWKKAEKEKEEHDFLNNERLAAYTAIKGTCSKERLLELIQHFTLYDLNNKIVAKYHQYLGVQNSFRSFEEKRLLKDAAERKRLGVFWHTQGSGKSFSMIFLSNKIMAKYATSHTILVVTDRKTLDKQIHQNFILARQAQADTTQTKSFYHQAGSSHDLRNLLSGLPQRYIFTLIHKFGLSKGERLYPVLSERNNIIVMIDEAHRTEYGSLAENMRRALPNAQYIAFTGTPLLDESETTRKWFGDYVSEYNFSQSIADGATVPLYYENRLPQVILANEDLEEEFLDIVDKTALSEEQTEVLKAKHAKTISILKADDRLEKIAEDIVQHFFYQKGFRGKAMVVSIDKFTTVKMYDKVQQYWKQEERKINLDIQQLKKEKGKESAAYKQKKAFLRYIKKCERYVILSEENGENEKFAKEGLDIASHRQHKQATLEERFKATEDPFCMVFLCAKWLTGFDAPAVTTLYLDKPMRNHTLMQAISRANRCLKDKVCGKIIDYCGIVVNLEEALKKYAKRKSGGGNTGGGGQGPVEKTQALIKLLKEAVEKLVAFLNKQGINFLALDQQHIVNDKDTVLYKKLCWAANKLIHPSKKEKEFRLLSNTVISMYRATLPNTEISDLYRNRIEILKALKQIIATYRRDEIDKGDLKKASKNTLALLDDSIHAFEYKIGPNMTKPILLQAVDLEEIDKAFRSASEKWLKVHDLQSYLKQRLTKMLEENENRIDFAEELEKIVEKYNSNTANLLDYFDKLVAFAKKLREEEVRHIKENLTKDEIVIFDMLCKPKLKEQDKQAVKKAAKELLAKLKLEKDKLFILDWHKKDRNKAKIKDYLIDVLDASLPASYDEKIFDEKTSKIYHYFLEKAANEEAYWRN